CAGTQDARRSEPDIDHLAQQGTQVGLVAVRVHQQRYGDDALLDVGIAQDAARLPWHALIQLISWRHIEALSPIECPDLRRRAAVQCMARARAVDPGERFCHAYRLPYSTALRCPSMVCWRRRCCGVVMPL